MQFHSFEMTEQPRLRLMTEHAESLLRKAEDITPLEDVTPVIDIAEAISRKEPPRTTTFMPEQPQAYIKLNKYDFF